MIKLPQTRQNNIVVQEFDSELLIYDLGINKAFCLNQTSAIVFQLCNGKNSVSEISHLMSRKLKILVSEEVVWLALDQLKKDNLIENNEGFLIHCNGLTRRQVIRKIGLTSMIALPLISPVIAPSAVNAQSCIAPGGSGCTFAGFTQSNCCGSNQRCLSTGACGNCYPTSISVDSCIGSGCCANSTNSGICCNPGSLQEILQNPITNRYDCRCP